MGPVRTPVFKKLELSFAEEYGARVVVVSIPEGSYVNMHAYRNIQRVGYSMPENLLASDAPDRAIEMACDQAGVPFFQATQAFKDHRDDPGLFYELDGHLTAEGHALYADTIAPLLAGEVAADPPKK